MTEHVIHLTFEGGVAQRAGQCSPSPRPREPYPESRPRVTLSGLFGGLSGLKFCVFALLEMCVAPIFSRVSRDAERTITAASNRDYVRTESRSSPSRLQS